MDCDRPLFCLERLGFADDIDWLPGAERTRIEAPAISLRLLARAAWLLATAVSLVAVGFIPPSRRQRGKQGGLRRRMLRSAVRRWLGPQVIRARDASDVDNAPDGSLIRIEGTVRSRHQYGSARDCSAPFEQLAFTLELGSDEHARRYHLVRERAMDFELLDRRGSAIRIQVADARLIGPPIAQHERPEAALRKLEPAQWPSPLDQRWPPFRKLSMGTYRLKSGDQVEIYGTKDRLVDRDMTERLARQDPIRLALRSSPSIPLIILVS